MIIYKFDNRIRIKLLTAYSMMDEIVDEIEQHNLSR